MRVSRGVRSEGDGEVVEVEVGAGKRVKKVRRKYVHWRMELRVLVGRAFISCKKDETRGQKASHVKKRGVRIKLNCKRP